ncbi:carboxymuconolactone decarboxylase family protein [Micromonospora sediminicola]|uniref:carboxymuconolactone decarboxylase family protein n=1 Tax=Micromonospora sediminicola TaxID=946078 RepID=UPI0033FD8DD6
MSRIFQYMSARVVMPHVLHVAPVDPRRATGLTARVYAELEADFGMLAPPVILHSPSPLVMAAAWALLRETLLVPGVLTRAQKEAVALEVSQKNRCPYCVDVHRASLGGLVGVSAVELAMSSPHDASVTSPLNPVVRSLRAIAAGRQELTTLSPTAVAELLGVAVAFEYLNRMVNVFLTDSPLPTDKAPARWTARLIMGSLAKRTPAVGGSFGDHGDTALPPDLQWAEASPHIAAALAGAVGAFERAGHRSVPQEVRGLVEQLVTTSTLSHTWAGSGHLDGAISDLPADLRDVATFALLTAVASYRVPDALVKRIKAHGLADHALVDLAAWATFAAARRVYQLPGN